MDFEYKPDGRILHKFLTSDSFVRGIRGPVGSGTSSACCVEIFRRASEQAPGQDGIRRSRWGIIRNTNPQLKTTTIKTWLEWFPVRTFGKFKWEVPYNHTISIGSIEAEVIFLALDRPEDVDKLLSFEFTGIWINEAREIPKSIVDAATMRVGRYPAIRSGGPTWYGVIMDTNAPEEDHWWPIMEGSTPIPDNIPQEQALMLRKPDDWEFFIQPQGMTEKFDSSGKQVLGYEKNDKAENTINMVPNYYEKIINGKTKSWIDVYVMNRLGGIEEGRRVYPQYNDTTHVSVEPLQIISGYPVWVGIDFGLTPAAVFAQRGPTGRWNILRELVTINMGAVRFGNLIRSFIAEHFQAMDMKIYADPAGDQRAQSDESTPFQMLRKQGLKAIPGPTNDPLLRIGSVEGVLERMIDGAPGVMIDPSCTTLRQGFRSGYHYRRIQVAGDARYEDKPSKNKFSHVHDALQYLLTGAGESKNLIGGANIGAAVAKRNFNVMDRRSTKRKRSWSGPQRAGL